MDDLNAWVDKTTGAITIFQQDRSPEGFSLTTHDLLEPCPPQLFDGQHDWDPVTRTCVRPVPEQVTARQLRLALTDMAIDDDVEIIIATMPKRSKIEWEYASVVERTHPLIATAATQLGWTEAYVDEIFRLAETL